MKNQKKLAREYIEIDHPFFNASKDFFTNQTFLTNIKESNSKKKFRESWDSMSINYIILELSL